MIFTVGLDEPTQVPEEVLKDAVYKIDNHYYITNGDNIREDDYLAFLKKPLTLHAKVASSLTAGQLV